MPFLFEAFTVPNHMIEETSLPESSSAAGDGGSYNALQTAHPNTQIKIEVPRNKQMNVIWHNDVTTESDPAPLRFTAVGSYSRMNRGIC